MKAFQSSSLCKLELILANKNALSVTLQNRNSSGTESQTLSFFVKGKYSRQGDLWEVAWLSVPTVEVVTG